MPLVKSQPKPTQDNFTVSAKKRLIELGLTITELASIVGASRTATSQAINNGMHAPTRKRIADHLSIPLLK